ncbi:copper resistance protein CopC [Domibacillus sp. A3M-37]|uniref:copper resistance CopC family protein n=1 Tax=Domibacillus sp. A3M-37 TaxID=2962037 RepID=UPI0020B6F1EF|nr:copper resistance CopC family protein [Domibacillus sp. A3M-37]MCP3763627.1 copper resistance protein CopC [Domibacillus sp. A3M-37]
MKKSFVFLFSLLFLFSPSVSAHTGLESSSPADGETITEPVQNISLTFETVIESGSSFTLNSESAEVPLESVTVTDNVVKGSTAEPLQNGTYTVDWRIVGEDGHLIEGTYGFTVSAKQEVEPATEEADTVEENSETAKEAPADVQQEETISPAGTMPIVLGVIIAAALIAAFVLMRKGKK